MQTCRWCKNGFDFTREEQECYRNMAPVLGGMRYDLPPPTLCPSCRMQRRTAFRNERKLYPRNCGLCKRSIVSIYSADKPFVVYCPDCFWSDRWDPLASGQDIDFSLSFREQYAKLQSRTPLLSNIVFNSENCEYNVFCVDAKDCYMCTRVAGENIYYSYLPLQCLWCVDCTDIFDSQYCYECVDCWNCYNAKYATLCRNCTDCVFCYDCIGCRNCFGCAGLRNAEYCFFNERCTKETFAERLKAFDQGDYGQLMEAKKQFEAWLLTLPRRALVIDQSENAEGSYIARSKDIHDCFDVEGVETARHSWGIEYAKDIFDCACIYHGERCLENISNSGSTDISHSFAAFSSHDLRYCMLCFNNVHDCFGCISLKQQQHCIFNKRYEQKEYERLVAQLIEHMRKTPLHQGSEGQAGEWGEFFDPSLALWGYNETVAQEYFPLTKEQALERGFRWSDYEAPSAQAAKNITATDVPGNINDVSDDILQTGILCEATGKPFRIIKQELGFYRDQHLPLPRFHPDMRYYQRSLRRTPRKLWDRQCANCHNAIRSAYAPDRPEIVYCEKCYLETVY